MRGPWPVPMWILVQIWLAARWRRTAERETDRAVAVFGPAVEKAEKLPQADQRRIVLDLALRYCMLPANIYEFRVYRHPEAALNFVFATETKGLHRAINGRRHHPDETVIQDKAAFAKQAGRVGLPCVPTLAHLQEASRASVRDLAALCESGVFFKSRTGHRGLGAFSLCAQERGITGRMLDGRPLTSAEAAQGALDGLLRDDDVLVQPLLRNHPILARAASPGEAVVLRVTTRRCSEGADILAAFLRFPVRVNDLGKQVLVIDVVAQIDTKSGRILRNPDSVLSLLPQTKLLEDRAFQTIPHGTSVPFWPEIAAHSRQAQETFSGLWAIGWDWIVTSEGPSLLEGNVYWDTKRPQEVAGGLVLTLLKNPDT